MGMGGGHEEGLGGSKAGGAPAAGALIWPGR